MQAQEMLMNLKQLFVEVVRILRDMKTPNTAITRAILTAEEFVSQ